MRPIEHQKNYQQPQHAQQQAIDEIKCTKIVSIVAIAPKKHVVRYVMHSVGNLVGYLNRLPAFSKGIAP